MGKWTEDNERLTNVIEEAHAKMEKHGQSILKDSVAEAELDEEIRGLQAGDERRGSSASQAHGCCLDAGLLQQFVTMGAEQAMLQLSVLHGELRKIFEVQRQPAPVTPRCMSLKERWKKREEKNMRRSRKVFLVKRCLPLLCSLFV